MQTVKATRSVVRAELGRTTIPYEKDCVLMYQDDTDEHKAIVVFEIEDGFIKRYDLCIPQLYQIEKKKIFPV